MSGYIACVYRAVASERKSLPAPLPFAKRKITKRTVPALVFLALLYGCSRPEAEDRLAAMRARGTLRWGGDMQGGEPYVFQDPGSLSGLRGFEVEIAGALARRLGLVAEFVQNDWQTLIPSLERGDFDVALNGIEVTPQRRARVAFTRPYYAFTETLVVRRDDRSVHGLGDPPGEPLGTREGSLALALVPAAPGVQRARAG